MTNTCGEFSIVSGVLQPVGQQTLIALLYSKHPLSQLPDSCLCLEPKFSDTPDVAQYLIDGPGDYENVRDKRNTCKYLH